MQNLKNKIHHANCFDILSQLEDKSIDLVLTDPPYLNTYFQYDKLANSTLDFNLWFKEILRVSKDNAPILIFGNFTFMIYLYNICKKYFRYELIWNKTNGTNFLDSYIRPRVINEYVLVFLKSMKRGTIKYNHGVLVDKTNQRDDGKFTQDRCPYGMVKKVHYKKLNNKKFPTNIINIKKPTSPGQYPKLHPSMKPFDLIETLVLMYSNEGDLVLDTFSGSGVLAQVCLNNKRDFICTELDKMFYDISINALKGDLFTMDLYGQ